MSRGVLFAFCLLLLVQFFPLHGAVSLYDTIPVEKNLRQGVLPNGLQYYLRYNERPENRVVLRLVVMAGSIQETEYEQGLAHFVEHMAFNVTENFEKSELVDFLEKSGIRFGPDLNAYTSFVNTVYMLQVPADRKGLLDTAYIVLEEWAHRVAMEEEEIDKERGVVIEEWRLGLGARDRMWRETSRCILKDSRYADRLPIGDVEIIRHASYDTIRAFYKTWYRPELMAVIVVGDIDVEEAEQRIIEQFSGMRNPENAPARKRYTIPQQEEPQVCIVADREATYSLITLYYDKQPLLPSITWADYKEDMLLTTLFTSIFNERYNELKEHPDAPFVYSSSYFGDFYQAPVNIFAMNVVVKDSLFEQAAQTLFSANEKMRRFGITQAELDRAKLEVLNAYERALNEKDRQHSGVYAESYMRHFMQGEAIPSIEDEHRFVHAVVPEITLEDINRVTRKLLSDMGLVITIQTPEGVKRFVPSEEEVMSLYEEIKESELTPYQAEDLDKTLIGEEMLPSIELEKKEEDDVFGYTTYYFTNGMKLLAKPTDFKNDELMFKAISKGGHSVFDDTLYLAARYAGRYLERAGVSAFNRLTLNRILSGKDVSMNFRIGEITEAFHGKSSVRDMELLFQLFYLSFTDYREDQAALSNLIRDDLVRFENVRQDPRSAFYDSLHQVASMHDSRRFQYPSPEQLQQMQLQDVLQVLSVKTENIQDYTFIVAGNYDEDELIRLFSTYVGAIAPGKVREKWEDRLPSFPSGVSTFTMHQGEAPQSQVVIMMQDTLFYSRDKALQMNLLSDAFSIQLRESIREDLGGTYHVHVSMSLDEHPHARHSLLVAFGCDPSRVDTLVNTIFDEMELLSADGPSEENLMKSQETQIRQREEQMQHNSFWLRALSSQEMFDYKVEMLEQFTNRVTQIKSKDLQQIAREIIKPTHYLKGILMPEIVKKE